MTSNLAADGNGVRRSAEIAAVRQIPSYILNRFRPIEIDQDNPPPDWNQGYLVTSTAPANVEEIPSRFGADLPESFKSLFLSPDNSDPVEMNQGYLREIASALKSGEGDLEIIIAVHGFSNNLEAAITWYSEIYKHVRLNSFLGKRNSVFLGYRWPSERPFAPFPGSIRWALCALPTLPKGLLIAGTSLTLALFIGIHLFPSLATGLFGAAILPLFLVGFLVALLAERLFVYFRDGFRAN
jgi:hypothetical protein